MTTKQNHQIITTGSSDSTDFINSNDLNEENTLLAKAISMSLNNFNNTNNNNIDDELNEDRILAQAISMSINNSNNIKKQTKEQTNINLFHDNLWALAEENIFPLLYSRCKADVIINISGKKMHCLLDTGAQMNCMTIDIVKKYGLESFMDTRYKGTVVGVGSSNIIGMIPYIEIKFGKITCAANFTILENKKNNNALSCTILGLPFIMFYKIKLDFEKSKLTIMGHDIDIQIKEQ